MARARAMGHRFIASNSAQSVGHPHGEEKKMNTVSSPLIRLNPWDRLSAWMRIRSGGFIASNSAQSVGLYGLGILVPVWQVSSPLIRLNPWDYAEDKERMPFLGFIASNSAQSVGH